MAVYNLRRVQLGKESTWGTPLEATSLMRLEDASITLNQESEVYGEIGYVGPSSLAGQNQRSAEGSLAGVLTYEDVLYIAHGMFGSVTPTGSNPYTWTYNAPVSAAVTPQSYTLEYGMSGAEYRVPGALIAAASISGEAGKPVRFECDIIGKTVQAQTMTGELTVRATNPVLMAHAGLYVDDWGGTMGTTAVTASLINFELTVNPNRHLKFFECVEPSGYGDGVWETTLKLALEWNASSKALVDGLVSGMVQRQIELRFTDGTRLLKLQFAGTLTSQPELFGNRDGNATVELEFSGTYNSRLANYLKVIAVNAVETLP